VLHVTLSGQFPKERFHSPENLFRPLIEACAAHQCRKALVDARAMQAEFSTVDLFRAGQDAASLTTAGLRIALLAREEMHDPFFDQVVANRSGRVGVFTDTESALAWLAR
jgi:hypothetical protein